jgi:hypothetical protein
MGFSIYQIVLYLVRDGLVSHISFKFVSVLMNWRCCWFEIAVQEIAVYFNFHL